MCHLIRTTEPRASTPPRRDRDPRRGRPPEPEIVVSKAAKLRSVCRRTRSSSSGSAGSIGWRARSSAFCNCSTSLSACFRSSIDSGVPQCAQAAPAVTSTGAPQLAQLTLPTFRRKLLDLLRRQRPDEVFLAEEVEKRRQPAVRVRTAQILELRGPLDVVGPAQPGLAARTLGEIGVRTLRPGDLLADDAKQLERRARRQRRALVRVEPERLTDMADVDRGAASQMGVERRLLHRRGAARTVHGRHFM